MWLLLVRMVLVAVKPSVVVHAVVVVHSAAAVVRGGASRVAVLGMH